ncbi:MAG: acetyl-CoA carboxylase biotin carboxyl carrier protein [Gemmatimonadaceae bacterium]|nr:acetyl-CoA carboxylase biotin carboxyl carrier protein [Gemmatimonadaceae bacterium]
MKKLVEMLDESSLDSIEISTEKGLKIRVSKAVASVAAVAGIAPAPMLMAAATSDPRLSPPGGIPIPAVAAAPAAAPSAEPAPALLEVKSPMVGTFYAAPEPGAKPFVAPGMRVAKGQVLCIIEAMKIMNEVESEHAGVVREVVATEAHPVEYGQVLFRIDPNG